ncbi:hypothetical protein O181_025637 [Austropuccinia psidii MF-1]|uniref:Uncharacterized protein n=1 Tax=Austropuccinia psidii MF-1 TaxID=1389203 RepID=A0A9Q3H023_9BASI|nr:hypothetical protein [Austropuccinia psidii MF-1]
MFFNQFPPVVCELSASMVPYFNNYYFSSAPAEPSMNTETLDAQDTSSPLAIPPSSPSTVDVFPEEPFPLVQRSGWNIVIQPLHQKA